MSESTTGGDTRPLLSAGAMLREARQAQGLHIAALATQLKVTPRKLELLESDQYDELQGAAFVRPLAQAACRALKIDPAPVLARLPGAQLNTLDQVNGGLNAPFREHGARRAAVDMPEAKPVVLGLVALLLAGASALWLVPHDWTLASLWPDAAVAPAPVASAVEGPLAAAASSVSAAPSVAASAVMAALTVAAASPSAGASAIAESVPGAVAPAQILQVRATAPSWVEVVDGAGQRQFKRLIQPGESVDVDANPPLRVTIGNAAGTELSFRGQLVDLAPSTRDNVARLELK